MPNKSKFLTFILIVKKFALVVCMDIVIFSDDLMFQHNANLSFFQFFKMCLCLIK